jgi:hypothetical protein
MRILGSVPLTDGSRCGPDPDEDPDPDTAPFVSVLHDANKIIFFFFKFLCLFLFEGTFTSFFKGKSYKAVTKQ